MTKEHLLKLGQIGGACLMLAGLVSWAIGTDQATDILMVVGLILFGGCSLVAWLFPKNS